METSEERIELRGAGGPLLGVLLLHPLRLEVKRGHRLFEVDLAGTLAQGAAVVFERVLRPYVEGEIGDLVAEEGGAEGAPGVDMRSVGGVA